MCPNLYCTSRASWNPWQNYCIPHHCEHCEPPRLVCGWYCYNSMVVTGGQWLSARTLTPTEVNWTQIENECLAAIWVCEKFSCLMGLPCFCQETDYFSFSPPKILVMPQLCTRGCWWGWCASILMSIKYKTIADTQLHKPLPVQPSNSHWASRPIHSAASKVSFQWSME